VESINVIVEREIARKNARDYFFEILGTYDIILRRIF